MDRAQESRSEDRVAVLCIDAGGSACKAVILNHNGIMATGEAGSCNVSTLGIAAALSSVSLAVDEALRMYANGAGHPELQSFSSVWVGMAGYDRPSLKPLIRQAVEDFVQLPPGATLLVTADIDLLPAVFIPRGEIDHVIVMVSGTGSVVMSYDRDGSLFKRTARVGGWGYLLGDDGSGYHIGRQAIRKALAYCDYVRLRKVGDATSEVPSALVQAVLSHFQIEASGDQLENLLSDILLAGEKQHLGDTPTKRIASVAKIIFALAESDTEALGVMEMAASELARLVHTMADAQQLDCGKTGLVLAGGLSQSSLCRKTIVRFIESRCGLFACTEVVERPAEVGAQYLLNLKV